MDGKKRRQQKQQHQLVAASEKFGRRGGSTLSTSIPDNEKFGRRGGSTLSTSIPDNENFFDNKSFSRIDRRNRDSILSECKSTPALADVINKSNNFNYHKRKNTDVSTFPNDISLCAKQMKDDIAKKDQFKVHDVENADDEMMIVDDGNDVKEEDESNWRLGMSSIKFPIANFTAIDGALDISKLPPPSFLISMPPTSCHSSDKESTSAYVSKSSSSILSSSSSSISLGFNDHQHKKPGKESGVLSNAMNFSQPQMAMDLSGEVFKPANEISDLDLKANEQMSGYNGTFLMPDCKFDGQSMSGYLRANSEPLDRIDDLGFPGEMTRGTSKSNLQTGGANASTSAVDISSIDAHSSFLSVLDDISVSDKTMAVYKKLMNRKKEKRESNKFPSSKSNTNSPTTSDTGIGNFAPSANSTTLSSSDDCRSSGEQGSLSLASTQRLVQSNQMMGTRDMLSSRNTFQSQHSPQSALFSQDALSVGPNNLDLSIGCFVPYKLNYLKVNNRTSCSFEVKFKLVGNVETLNCFDIQLPDGEFIPPLFNGLLTNKIVITPLKCGIFNFAIEICSQLQGVPVSSALQVHFTIKSEMVNIKRVTPFPGNKTHIEMNFIANPVNDTMKTYLKLVLQNEHFSEETPLKFTLTNSNHRICFPSSNSYRPQDFYRCSDPYTIHTSMKNKCPTKIPLTVRAHEITSVVNYKATLGIQIDSASYEGYLGTYDLDVKVWPQSETTDACLQWSRSSENHKGIELKPNVWERINLRNKSEKQAIWIQFECMQFKDRRSVLPFKDPNLATASNKPMSILKHIKLSETYIVIPPKEKYSIGILFGNKIKEPVHFTVLAKYSGGIGNIFSANIPITVKTD